MENFVVVPVLSWVVTLIGEAVVGVVGTIVGTVVGTVVAKWSLIELQKSRVTVT